MNRPSSARRRRTAVLLPLLALPLALAACSGGPSIPSPAPVTTTAAGPGTSAPATSPGAGPSSGPVTPFPSGPSVAPGPGSESPTPTPAPASTPGPARCAAADLQVAYADDSGGGGGGHVAGTLTFTNTGARACSLRGYPGVSYVDAGRAQVGAAATRTEADVRTVTLAPRGRARAAVQRANPGLYGEDCRPRPVTGLRVYPPGSTTALTARFRTTGCAAATAPLLEVSPVR